MGAVMEKDIERILLTTSDIDAKVKSLGAELTKDYADKNPILLGLLKGSVMFMADLMKHLDMPIEIEFMDVSSYHGVESTGQIKILKDLDTSVKDRHVIIAEDIVDTGRTLEYVIELLKLRGAKSVEMVTLLYKKEARLAPIEAKYIGFSIPKAFVVGYGLDYNEKYRNLPYIGILKQSVYE